MNVANTAGETGDDPPAEPKLAATSVAETASLSPPRQPRAVVPQVVGDLGINLGGNPWRRFDLRGTLIVGRVP